MGSSFPARETNYIMKECLRKENIYYGYSRTCNVSRVFICII